MAKGDLEREIIVKMSLITAIGTSSASQEYVAKQIVALIDPDELRKQLNAEIRIELGSKAFEKGRKQEQEKYDEAVVLITELAGINQTIFMNEDIRNMADRAEEILKKL